MKQSAFFLAALCSGALLLASCTHDQAADSTTSPATTAPESAAGSMAGMDHSAMNHEAAASSSPQLKAMNEMMTRMHTTKLQGNTDLDFARHMLEHHKGAVVMADLELRDGKDATMRQLAARIKADQQKEITELEAATARLATAPANYEPNNPADPFTSKMNASMEGMMQTMPQAVANPDLDFNRLMTVHHQSAVDMAQAELAHGKDPKLKQLAQQMITAQQQEIQQLKDWHHHNADKR